MHSIFIIKLLFIIYYLLLIIKCYHGLKRKYGIHLGLQLNSRPLIQSTTDVIKDSLQML